MHKRLWLGVMAVLLIMLSIDGWALRPLKAEQVFHQKIVRMDANQFSITWTLPPGYFLYKDRIQFNLVEPEFVQLGRIHFPKANRKKNALGQTFYIYPQGVTLTIPVLATQPGESLVNVHFQGCSNEGYCYPPLETMIKLSFGNDKGLNAVAIEPKGSSPAKPAQINMASIKTFDLFSILTFYGLGLLLAFTPCVLPMVPVLSGLIVGHGLQLTQFKAFKLSFLYVLSMSLTYAIVGALIARIGQNLQVIMQSPIVISLFSLIFLALALSMFNLYQFRLPEFFQARLAKFSRAHAHGQYWGTALMGALSILILSPCVTPPLIAVLGFIAQSGELGFGMLSLFSMGLGMGTPLLILGASLGHWLPKAGHWMNAIKTFFGVLMLALAIHLMGRILPTGSCMFLWGALLIFYGFFLGNFVKKTPQKHWFSKGLSLILLIQGVLIWVGGALGHDNPLLPLAKKISSKAQSLYVVRSPKALERALLETQGRPVLLDFYADWCSSCKNLEAKILKDPTVMQALKDFSLIRIDITAQTASEQALMAQFEVVAPPVLIFLNASHHRVHSKLIGDISPNLLLTHLQSLDSKDQ